MNRNPEITALTRRLEAAQGAGDLARLGEIYRELGAWLPRVAGRDRVSGQDAAAWIDLRRAHERAELHCAAELARLGRQLGELRAHREGWVAYALQDPAQGASS